MEKIIPRAPLFRDPVYDGAADPVVIWKEEGKEWWMFYTNRRAFAPNTGVSFVHGTDIGIATSADNGRNWIYRGTAQGLEFEPGRNTFWAPEVMEHNGRYHMYCSYVRGIPMDWNCDRKIIHYESEDLFHWSYQNEVILSSNRVIDACVYQMTDQLWKMWYKDEINGSHTWAAYSRNLNDWEVSGPEITDCGHEGPNVFEFHGYYWMITDPWDGLGVYRSDDATHWERKENILKEPGLREDDGFIASHADVVVIEDRAYIFYFVHPGMDMEFRQNEDPDKRWTYEQRRSSIQVAQLEFDGDTLICDRNQTFYFGL